MGKSGKKYVAALLGLLLVGAVYANYAINRSGMQSASRAEPSPSALPAALRSPLASPNQTYAQGQENYFASFREEREAVREKEIGYLNEIIAVSGSDAETLQQAQEQKLRLVENMEAEFTIENLITAKGFPDAAVTFHSGSVNVVVDAASLDSEQVAQILDIVKRETGESASNIKIMSGGQ